MIEVWGLPTNRNHDELWWPRRRELCHLGIAHLGDRMVAIINDDMRTYDFRRLRIRWGFTFNEQTVKSLLRRVYGSERQYNAPGTD